MKVQYRAKVNGNYRGDVAFCYQMQVDPGAVGFPQAYVLSSSKHATYGDDRPPLHHPCLALIIPASTTFQPFSNHLCHNNDDATHTTVILMIILQISNLDLLNEHDMNVCFLAVSQLISQWSARVHLTHAAQPNSGLLS